MASEHSPISLRIDLSQEWINDFDDGLQDIIKNAALREVEAAIRKAVKVELEKQQALIQTRARELVAELKTSAKVLTGGAKQ